MLTGRIVKAWGAQMLMAMNVDSTTATSHYLVLHVPVICNELEVKLESIDMNSSSVSAVLYQQS
jgi:hypothetical protein